MLIFGFAQALRASRRWLFIAVILLTFVPWTTARESAQIRGRWETLAPAIIKRTEVAAAAIGENIYLIGGFREPSWFETLLNPLFNRPSIISTDAVEEYDLTLDRWRLSGTSHTGSSCKRSKCGQSTICRGRLDSMASRSQRKSVCLRP